ncbi:MAG: AAA family ATPase, partial [Planctomycetaceae bacterium]|nr:AAA family ATPase [Planctomycetaceae bacterium]
KNPREWAQQILDFCQSYSEVSPSGTGYKIICRGELPESLLQPIPIPGGEKREQIEHWNSGRHFCFTGERLEQYPAAIADIDGEAFAEEVAEINPECRKPTKSQTLSLNLALAGNYATDYREIEFIENRIQSYLRKCEFSEGNRNNQLNKKTWTVRGISNSQGEVLPPTDIARIMRNWNESQTDPLPYLEAEKTIESALKASPPELNPPESRNPITSSPGVSKPKVNESADDWQAFKTFGPPAIQPNGKAPPMADFVIDFILRRGETMNVIAASKEGKSWLAMGMACHLIAGTRWLQRFQATPSRVLMIDNELHGATFDNRWLRVCEAHGLSQGQACKLNRILLRGKNQDINGIEAWLLNEINPGDFDVIVIDALYRTLPKGVSENDNADMMTIYNQLDEIAAALDCAVIIIHHSSKGNQGFKSVTDVGSGAGSISRAADTHLVIRPHKQKGYSVLDFRTRSFPPQDSLSIYFEFPKWLPSDLTPEVAAKQIDKQKAEKDTQDLQKIIELFGKDEKFT